VTAPCINRGHFILITFDKNYRQIFGGIDISCIFTYQLTGLITHKKNKMMTTTKELSKEQGIAIIRWYDSKSENWGSWGNYPVLGLGASYLQYDTNPCQINLDIPVMINGEKYNCISCGRSVGKKMEQLHFIFRTTRLVSSRRTGKNRANSPRCNACWL